MAASRRDFLRRAALAAGLLAIDPKELLWRPTKKIFIPPPKLRLEDVIDASYDAKTGLSIRFIRGHDLAQNKYISRLDALYFPLAVEK